MLTHHGCAATKQPHRMQSPINIDTAQPFTTGTSLGLLKATEIVQGLHYWVPLSPRRSFSGHSTSSNLGMSNAQV